MIQLKPKTAFIIYMVGALGAILGAISKAILIAGWLIIISISVYLTFIGE